MALRSTGSKTARRRANTLVRRVHCVSRSDFDFDFIEFEPDPLTQPRLHPRSGERRYSFDCSRAERDDELAHLGTAGWVTPRHMALTPCCAGSRQLLAAWLEFRNKPAPLP